MSTLLHCVHLIPRHKVTSYLIMCWYKDYLAFQMFWDTVGWHWTSLWHGWTDMDGSTHSLLSISALYLFIYKCRLRPSNVKHATCNTPQHPETQSTYRGWLWHPDLIFFFFPRHSLVFSPRIMKTHPVPYDRVWVPHLPTCTPQAWPPLKIVDQQK